MAEQTAAPAPPVGASDGPPPDEDSLSQLQRKLDDIGQMFYTYVGIVQRDAPPSGRGADDGGDQSGDAAQRAELFSKIPDYARDIVQTSKDIDATIDAIEAEMRELPPTAEKPAIERADADSLAAAKQLEEAAVDANRLLADVRDVIAMRDQDDVAEKKTKTAT